MEESKIQKILNCINPFSCDLKKMDGKEPYIDDIDD